MWFDWVTVAPLFDIFETFCGSSSMINGAVAALILGSRSGDELVSRTLSTPAFLCIFLFRLSSMFFDLVGVATQASLCRVVPPSQ